MKQYPFSLNAVAALFALGGGACMAASAAAAVIPEAQTDALPVADVVVVSATRVGHASFDMPASIDVVDSARIQDGQMRVNASEALAAAVGPCAGG